MTTLLLAAGVTAIDQTTTPLKSSAAEYGYGQWRGGFWAGNYIEAGTGAFLYCLDIDRAEPIGVQTTYVGMQGFIGPAGGVNDLSGDILAGINMVISRYGQTTNAAQARAVNDAIWIVASNFSTADPLSNQYAAEIRAYRQGATSSTGSMTMTFQVDRQNNYDGTLTVATMSTSPATGTIRLTNGVFTDSGSATRTGTFSVGQTFPVRGVPPTPGAEYKIGATADLTASIAGGGSYAPQLGVWERGNFQRLGGPGGQNPSSVRMQTTVEDPAPRSSAFFPLVSTQVVTEELAVGDTFQDVLTFSLGDNGEGTVNEWPPTLAGTYFPVVADCAVPADAPIALSVNDAVIGDTGITDLVSPQLSGGAWLREGGVRVPVTVNGTWYFSETEPVRQAAAPTPEGAREASGAVQPRPTGSTSCPVGSSVVWSTLSNNGPAVWCLPEFDLWLGVSPLSE